MHALLRRVRRDDQGITLVVAIMVMGVVTALTLTIVTLAITVNNQSGRDRQRTVAVNAAEAAVDASYASIQAAGTTLPCVWPSSGTAGMSASPDRATSSATITYLKKGNDGALTPLGSCPTAADTGANTPVAALIRGAGETNALAGGTTNKRVVESLVNVSPVYGDTLDKAIFADAGLQFTNQTTLTGNQGADADVYTNGNFVCSNNQKFAGSVYAQGSITVQGSCTIAGDVWAKGAVLYDAGANGSIGGRVLSSTSSIGLPGNFSVNGSLLAAGNISWPGCSTAGKCLANTTVAAPPTAPFPILRGDTATLSQWPGFTVESHLDCATVKDAIINTYAKRGTPTIVRTPCAVNFNKDKNIKLQNDLAIFSFGGISSANQVGFVTDGTPRSLYWVVPYDDYNGVDVSRPCTAPGIRTDNQFNFATDVDMFVYSPCDIYFANNSDHVGQIFGGSNVTINNQFTMQFRPVPVWGIDPTSLPLVSYKLDIVYKRETR